MLVVQHVLTTGSTTTYLNVQDKPWTQFGVTHERAPNKGHNVSVTPGKSIRLFGIRELVNGPVPYDLTFKVGDVCERDSFNLVYLGTIASIGPKTVAIRDEHSGKVTRLSLASFSQRNRDFDLKAIAKRNAEWMD